MTDFLETVTGKKVDQDPKHKRRRGGAAVLLAAGAIGVGVGANSAIDSIQGTGPTVENPATQHPEQHFKTYTVQGGDTLTGIVSRAYPNLVPYGPEFNARVAELDRQLAVDDQVLGTIRPGSTVLQLDESANLANLESRSR
jgi:hypothetical protein